MAGREHRYPDRLLARQIGLAPAERPAVPNGKEPVVAVRVVEYLPGKTAGTWTAAQWFMGETPIPDWQEAEPAPVVVGGGPQRFVRYSLPVALYRRHEQLVAEWRRYSEFGSGERDEQNRLGREDFLGDVRARMREAEVLPPDLPAELAHVDKSRP